jgi:hypothetical protein
MESVGDSKDKAKESESLQCCCNESIEIYRVCANQNCQKQWSSLLTKQECVAQCPIDEHSKAIPATPPSEVNICLCDSCTYRKAYGPLFEPKGYHKT